MRVELLQVEYRGLEFRHVLQMDVLTKHLDNIASESDKKRPTTTCTTSKGNIELKDNNGCEIGSDI
jgi:hypothetical protein